MKHLGLCLIKTCISSVTNKQKWFALPNYDGSREDGEMTTQPLAYPSPTLLRAHYTVILNAGPDISATRVRGRKETSEQRTIRLVIPLED